MFSSRFRIVTFFLFLLCLFFYDMTRASLAVAETDSGSLQDISTLLDQKKYQDAYQLAEKLSDQSAGEPPFDLLFGKAALVVQKPDVASLAFERVLMDDTKSVNARLGLAEAYYRLKMYDKAKVEAETLVANSHGAVFSDKTQRLMTKINRRGSLTEDKLYTWYGQIRFGFDDNVEITSNEDYGKYLDLMGSTISYDKNNPSQVAAYNGFCEQLKQYSKKLRSTYVSPLIGIGGKYAPDTKYSLFWDINGSHKDYVEISGYDADQMDLSFGINYKLDPNYFLSGGFYYQEYLLDGKRYRESPIGFIGLGKILNGHNTIKIYTNNGVLAYPDATPFNVNMHVGGLEWSYFDTLNLLTTQVFYGENHTQSGAKAYNGSHYYGIDISAKHKLTSKINLKVDATCQRQLYSGIDTTIPLAPVRRDTFKRFAAGVYYKFHPHYTWYVSSAYTDNNSNVFIYKYNRFEALTGIGFEF